MSEIPVWKEQMMKRTGLRNSFIEMCNERVNKHTAKCHGYIRNSEDNLARIEVAQADVYISLAAEINREIKEAQNNEMALGKKGDQHGR